jgi:adenosylcobinamide-GDP ribazoletransferase
VAFDALRLAAGLLSVLPVGRLPEAGPRTYGRAMLLAPLAVLPLALVAGLVFGAASFAGLPGAVVGLLSVAALALGTRALHLDGLADTVDGLGTGWDAERALAVMRRGDVGPMGAVALVLVLGLQAAALSALPPTPRGALAVALLVCASRAALLLVCRRGVPAARPDGLGRTVAGTVAPVAGGLAGLVAVAVVLLAAHLAGRSWPEGLVAAALAFVAVAVLVAHVVRRLGGVSGDVMGAAVEVALTALLIGLAR